MTAAAPVRIHRVEGTVMPVNSYVVEGPDGLVVVDGQLTVDDARAVRAVVDALDRPVAALVLTHGHPDHYAGAATLLSGLSSPILATAGVAEVVSRDDAAKDAVVGPMMGTQWPAARRFPDEVVTPGSTVVLGGLGFEVRDLGPGESGSDTLWSLGDDTVFCGDVAYSDMHAYLFDGHLEEWLAVLERLGSDVADSATLYVGHGRPSGKAVLARQASYVQAFVDAVSDALNFDEAGRHDRVVAAMSPLVGDDRSQFLMELSIEPVAAVLRSRS